MKDLDIHKVYKRIKEKVEEFKAPVVDLIEFQTEDPFKVLVATILSARTKDETTLQACKKLFKKVNKPADLNKLSKKEIEELIYPVGFYHNKAEHLKQLPGVLEEKFEGIIPETVDELTELPGVGRKTANLVVAVGFKKPAMCVDTHVHKISNRLGYVDTKTPLQTEMALRDKLPKKYWEKYNSKLVAFGQNICTPVSPWCSKCPVEEFCEKKGVKNSR